MEYRSRRDNLILYRLNDSETETWAQTDEKHLDALARSLNNNLTSCDIKRARRLGRFGAVKYCRVMGKFFLL